MIFNFLKAISYKLKAQSGFTLLEIIVVIAIFATIAAFGASPLLSFKKTGDLNSAFETGTSFLLSARAKTLSSENQSPYGVHFDDDALTLFPGSVFTEGSPGNKAAPLPASVVISDVSLSGGGNDVVFKRLTGETDMYGTITFGLKSDAGRTRTLRVEKTGIISAE